jgi:hypothetical protein
MFLAAKHNSASFLKSTQDRPAGWPPIVTLYCEAALPISASKQRRSCAKDACAPFATLGISLVVWKPTEP